MTEQHTDNILNPTTLNFTVAEEFIFYHFMFLKFKRKENVRLYTIMLYEYK